MSNNIILAIQVLPKMEDGNTVVLVDKIIEIIQSSGVKYKICPFETVMEGPYDKLIQIVGDTHQACLDAEVEEALINIRLELRPHRDITIEQKTSRYGV